MFWTTPASWLNDSSTRNELSRISHFRERSGDCAAARAATVSRMSAVNALSSRMSAAVQLDEQLRCRARADRDAPIALLQPHLAGHGVARPDLDRRAQPQSVAHGA